MAEPISMILQRHMEIARNDYHRLVLLVGGFESGKTSALRELANEIGVDVINVNLEISMQLMELTTKQRKTKTPKIIDGLLANQKDPILLDNLEILFDKHLSIDPLRVLQHISRNRVVVASWAGEITHGKLHYAEPEHNEHRVYDTSGINYVTTEGDTSLDQRIQR